MRGLDIAVFDDWMRQEARGEETGLGLSTLFYPMHRLERMERDETLGPIESYVGPLPPPASASPCSRRRESSRDGPES